MKNLVIVRAGANSLHPDWLKGRREFDVLISRYNPDLVVHPEPGVFLHDSPGGKWRGLHRTISENYGMVSSYDNIWLPDDDIATSPERINELFRIHTAFRLDLSQPSLSPESYYSHIVTMYHPRFHIRFTNFVEVMVPLFSRSLLMKVWSDFERYNTGWGFDFAWPSMTQFPKVAVIDAVQVTHTRPLQGPSKSGGVSGPNQGMREQFDYMSRKFITRPRTLQNVTLAGIMSDGEMSSLTEARCSNFIAIVLDAVNYLSKRNVIGYAQYCRAVLTYFEEFRQNIPEGVLEQVLADTLPDLDQLRADIARPPVRLAG